MAFTHTTTKNGILVTLLLALCFLVDNANAEWFTHGGDITNRRNGIGGTINPISVRAGLLRQRWKFLAGFDITATPSVAGRVVYFPSWNGNLYAVDAGNGRLIWKQSLGQLTGIPPTGRYVNVTVSRSTPVVAGDLLLVGIYGPAYVVAVRRATGQLVWTSLLDPGPLSLITQSGTFYNGLVHIEMPYNTMFLRQARAFYVGVSSLEELLPAGQCCTFRGSMVKLDVRTGKILWQTYTLPDNGGRLGGYSGAAIWGSSPAVDIVRGCVYVGTGNLYIAPADVLECQARQNNRTTPPSSPDQCFGPDVHFDSLLSFDINTGKIVWAKQLGGYDVFYFTCLVPNNPDCPTGPNLDADFGEAPMLLRIVSNGRLRDVVVAKRKAGPGSLEGGGVWGAATDGTRIYTNIVNGDNLPFTLKPSNKTTTAGGWVAMDANTGKILWTTTDPRNDTAHGPVTIVSGVLFARSVAPSGPVYAMDARTGAIIWSFDTGATVYGGASTSYGCIYIGHGYSIGLARFHPTWNSGKYVFAFCIT
ncbi:Polyvinyl alcohol dehydrogenase (cytochrome) [Handroanthus impetiginosus]|uniref:Polyvinyl alcohol dehydrogenase (Cytochrome) n=1 Tax=Handroanthus impetiginosus TaxID=429701 RepID=A0A2G9I6F5_9LAMI|nr:Polyvinyl alcohol dehydrogenase (cytochrome) [Handroanthus impetiginosus]